MKFIFTAIIIILILSISFDVVEGFRGGKRSGGCKRSGGRNRSGGPKQSHGYRGRIGGYRPRHRWVRGPTTRLYDTNNYYWGGWRPYPPPTIYDYYPSWLFTGRCRTGCGYMGNGVVGCVNPTNTPDSCIFASDCYGC